MQSAMWLVFSILSMLAYAATDLLGKRKVDAGSRRTPVELLASYGVLAVGAGGLFFLCGLGESGHAPWTTLASEPLLIASVLCHVSYWLLCLVSFRFLGLSVEAALGGTDGIVFFLGMVIVHALFGRLGAAREMLHPARLVPIVTVLTFAFLLPRAERSNETRRRTVVGLLILAAALLLDGGDTLLTAVIFDSGRVGPVDCMIASWFLSFGLIVCLLAVVRLKKGWWIVPFRGGFGTLGYAALAVLASITYLLASSCDAVRAGLVFAVAPIFPLLGARVILKERYTLRQTICIWMIVLGTIAFCIVDRIA